MSQIEFFEQTLQRMQAGSGGSAAVLKAMEVVLLEQKDYHRLFDARMMQTRQKMGLPMTRPSSLNNIPREQEAAYREAYVAAAREVGRLFLEDGRLADAWAYFRTIGEPEPVREALESVSIPQEPDAQFDELLNLALYEGAHPVRGLQFLLKTHGTCNTITAMGQLMPQLLPEERREAAAMMVRSLYADLQHSIRRDVESREPTLPPDLSIRELITERDWLLESGNYHIDVSHLHAAVGFARHLKSSDPELPLAIELCEYGARLAEQLRYPADVPFDDFYTAHHHFLSAIAAVNVDASMQYFVARLNDEPDDADKKLIAFVIVDLGQRVDRLDLALTAAAPFLSRLEDPNGFSFTEACVQAQRLDLLDQTARTNDDILALATAKLSQQETAEPTASSAAP